jgi:hypothetical protein
VRRFSVVEGLILLGLAAEVVVLLAIAWVSPPNNTDSLQYHMPRVVHWAQEGAIAHYATAYEPQLTLPIWAEAAILNLRVLWGNDRPANLVQLMALVGSWVAVAAVARHLGADRNGRLLSLVFVASLPIAVLQATSTQNDLAAAFWLVCLGYFVVADHQGRLSRLDWGLAGVNLGLALLTKGTLLTCAPVLGLWFLISRIRRGGWWRGLKDGAVALVLAAVLNLGFWARNVRTYGMPLGSPAEVQTHTYSNLTLRGVIASWVENLALDFATPSERANELLVGTVRNLRPEGQSQFGLLWAWNNENLAGNPIHVGLLALAVGGVFVMAARRRAGELRLAGLYAGAFVASALLFFSLLDFDIYGVRYQTPFLVALAPVVGVVAGRVGRPRWTLAVSLIVLLLGTPWVLLNASRPAIGWKPRTMIDSVFDETPQVILMANWTQLRDGYFGAADAARASGCESVGLRLDSHDLEYVYWWLLDAPQSGIRVENLDPPSYLERYVDPTFHPCAIVCMVCGGRTRFHGLERTYSSGLFSVFTGEGYVPTED